MLKVVSHIEGLCDETGKKVPYKVPFEGSPVIVELAKNKVEINGIVAVTFAEEEKETERVENLTVKEKEEALEDAKEEKEEIVDKAKKSRKYAKTQ